jgi:hypothetical protein
MALVSVTRKLDKLAAIATETVSDSDTKSALLGWVEASRKLVARRNKLMHSYYLVAPGGTAPHWFTSSTRGGFCRRVHGNGLKTTAVKDGRPGPVGHTCHGLARPASSAKMPIQFNG